MNPFLRLTACLLVIFAFSAAAALAWDRADAAAAQQPSTRAAAANTGSR